MNELRGSNEESSTNFRLFSSLFSEGEIYEQAKWELHENPEKIRNGVAVLKDRIRRNQLPTIEEDSFLLKFLRVKKFRHDDSYQSLEDFTYSLQHMYHKYGPTDINLLTGVLEKNICGILRYRDRNGRIVFYYRIGVEMIEGVAHEDLIKALVTYLFITMLEPTTQTLGVNCIFDCKQFCFRVIPAAIDRLVVFLKYLVKVPVRVHRVDVINVRTPFGVVYNAVKPWIPNKITERIFVHGKRLESLCDFYDCEAMCNEFGGTAGPLDNGALIDWLNKNGEFIGRLTELQVKAVYS